MSGPEKIIEQYLKERIEELGGVCWKWTSPGMRGAPDRVVLHPHIGVVFVELKSKAGKLSVHQRKAFTQISAAGGTVFVIDSKSGVDNFIDELILDDDVEVNDARLDS